MAELEGLTLPIKTALDATGLNQFVDLMGRVQADLEGLSSFIKTNTIEAFTDFSKAMLEIDKTISLSEEDFYNIKTEILDLSDKTGTAATELLKIVSRGGALGVATDNLVGFAETINKISIAIGADSTMIADSFVGILRASNLGITENNLIRLGDVIANLADTTGTSEQVIIGFLTSFSNTARAFGIGIEQAATWGATLKQLGIDAGAAAGGLEQAIKTMLSKEGLSKVATLLGTTSEQFKAIFSRDASAGIQMVLDSMSRITDATTKNQVATELFGFRGKEVMLALASNANLYRNNLDAARNSVGAISADYTKSMEHFTRQWELIWNAVRNFGIKVGEVLVFQLTPMMVTFGNFVRGILYSWGDQAVPILASIAKYILIITGVGASMAAIVKGFAMLSAIMSPLLLVMKGLAVGAAIFVAAFAIRNIIDDLGELFFGIKKITQVAFDAGKLLLETVIGSIKDEISDIVISIKQLGAMIGYITAGYSFSDAFKMAATDAAIEEKKAGAGGIIKETAADLDRIFGGFLGGKSLSDTLSKSASQANEAIKSAMESASKMMNDMADSLTADMPKATDFGPKSLGFDMNAGAGGLTSPFSKDVLDKITGTGKDAKDSAEKSMAAQKTTNEVLRDLLKNATDGKVGDIRDSQWIAEQREMARRQMALEEERQRLEMQKIRQDMDFKGKPLAVKIENTGDPFLEQVRQSLIIYVEGLKTCS